jgi:cell division protein FtsI/penicillin-binding protein 2
LSEELRFNFVFGLLFFIAGLFVIRSIELVLFSPLPGIAINSVNQAPIRGSIYDRDGNELAVSQNTYSIAVKPSAIESPLKNAEIIGKQLSLSATDLIKLFDDQSKPFVYLKRKVSSKAAKELKNLKIKGVIIEPEPNRFYPNDQLASALLGFTGLDNEGLSGIEYFLNTELSGIDSEANRGSDIYLTISSFLQKELESELNDAYQESKSNAASAVLLDVDSGNILAMVSLPNYNPNYAKDSPSSFHRNRSISDAYEPGSTFKSFILAALLNERSIPAIKKFHCPGYYQGKTGRISCTRKHGKQNLAQVIKNSCNSGIIEASKYMKPETLQRYLEAFGFGQSPAVSLPALTAGSLRPAKEWDEWLSMTIPIGHGLSASTLQMASAGLIIANDGVLPGVSIVHTLKKADGFRQQLSNTRGEIKIMDANAARVTRELLAGVVSPSGTGRLAAINDPKYQVCGKTGTAVKYTKAGYSSNLHQPSFLGFFPCKKPKVVLYIVFDEPKGEKIHGGQLAAPVVSKFIEKTKEYIHRKKSVIIKPMKPLSFTKTNNSNVMPNFTGQSKKEVSRTLFLTYPGEHKLYGSGYVISQKPSPGSVLKTPYAFSIQFSFPKK